MFDSLTSLSVTQRLASTGRRLRAALALVVAIATATTALAVTGSARADLVLVYGEDVSGHEPDHDWTASPAEFGIVKATEGLTFRDPSFARHWRELDKKGIVRGAYHYGHPRNDPIAEAEHFLSVVNEQPAKPGDLLVLDLETTDGYSVDHVNAWAKKWLAHVKAKTGATPLFYSGWNFANTYGRGLAEYPLWVAHYSRPKGDVTPPADWKEWVIHQYTEYPIDMNVSRLTPEQLRAFGRP